MGGILFVTKLALANIPNVNMNAVLIILCAVFFGWRSYYSLAIYILLEGLIFGFHVWWISYVFIWPILVLICVLMRKNDDALLWAVVAGAWGLAFGPLMYIPYFCIMGGWGGYFTMWVAGLAYDLTHCISNFLVTLVLYRPLKRALEIALGRKE